MQRAPMTLFCNKVQRANRRIQLRLSFQRVLQMAVYDQELEGVSEHFQKSRDANLLSRIFDSFK